MICYFSTFVSDMALHFSDWGYYFNYEISKIFPGEMGWREAAIPPPPKVGQIQMCGAFILKTTDFPSCPQNNYYRHCQNGGSNKKMAKEVNG